MRRIVFVTTGTERGGAELMLLKLLSAMDRLEFSISVVSLVEPGPVAEDLERLGIQVFSPRMSRSFWGLPGGVWALGRILRQLRPDVVQTWMYHADLVGGLAARFATRAKVIWGIRQSNLDPATSKKTTVWAARICAMLSGLIPELIACCSRASMTVHSGLGYRQDKLRYLPNGFDSRHFQPDTDAGHRFRERNAIPENALVIGNLSRFDPQKDLDTLLTAASEFISSRDNVVLVLAGQGMDSRNSELSERVRRAGLREKCLLLGELTDVREVLSGLDILTMCSAYGEGFPNIVAEAMLMEVPCVVTDVGDARDIVGGHGITIPIRSPEELCSAWSRIVSMAKKEIEARKKDGRRKIADEYGLQTVARSYEEMYRNLMGEAISAG